MASNQDIEQSIVRELGSFIKSESSTFACGGSIPFKDRSFSLRWDSAQDITKLNFPIDTGNDAETANLLKLIQDCQPATFGYKGEDVLDESYRKATKLDRSAFSVDFCPYEQGIVDTITQVLLPNVKGHPTNGVCAELYKLNIYAAPSGFFKAHVDTPRSDLQFGSLVVSLPCYHKGGELIVRHAGHTTTFDWGSADASDAKNTTVQWAAFYSDCEHEVLEVKDGHRITLTYNLFYSRGVGELAGNSPVLDVQSLPLYQKIQEALAQEAFMEEGGLLGIYCQHAYAHSTREGIKALPGVLKGADMAVYSVFQALNLSIYVRPIVHIDRDDYEWMKEQEREERGGSDVESDVESYGEEPNTYVGNRLHQVFLSNVGGCDESFQEILADFDGGWERVTWLTNPDETKANLGMAHLAYGNQADIDGKYTYAALLVDIPPAKERISGEKA